MKRKFLDCSLAIIRKNDSTIDDVKLEEIAYGLEGIYLTVTKTVIIFGLSIFLWSDWESHTLWECKYVFIREMRFWSDYLVWSGSKIFTVKYVIYIFGHFYENAYFELSHHERRRRLESCLLGKSGSPMIVEDWRRGSITRLPDSKAKPY